MSAARESDSDTPAETPAPRRSTRARRSAGPADTSPDGPGTPPAAHDVDPAPTAEPSTTDAPAAEWTPVASLVPYGRNPRRNDKTVTVVADSIRRFGWGAPIVARRETRTIIAGHARRGAALHLAQQWQKATSRERQTWHPDAVRVATQGEVVVRFVDLDEHESVLALIADNRIGEELSETDDEALAALLQELQAAHVNVLQGTGFSEESLAALLAEAAGDPGAGGTGGDPGEERYKSQFGVIVICADEPEQARVYEQLRGEGLNCRVVVT